MEFLSRLRLASIPNWSKYLFFVVLIIIGISNTIVFFDGLMYGKDNLVEISLRLLGVLLPILTILYVAIHIRYGENAILENTRSLYLETLPTALSQIEGRTIGFYPSGRSPANAEDDSNIIVVTNYQRGHIDADFRIIFDDGKYIMIRLEVNHRRINFNLYLNKEQIENICQTKGVRLLDLNNAEIANKLCGALGHSIAGAKYSNERVSGSESEAENYQSGYLFNDLLIYRKIMRDEYLCLVGMKAVTPEFIWDSGERFYFCFDLMLMLRAMIHECPAIKMS